jgi:hypothetical protein
MNYYKDNQEYADVDAVTLAKGALTANRDSTPVATDRGVVRLTLDVTAVSGTSPTLDVTIQTSFDKQSWTNVGTFTQATGVGKQRKVFTGLDRYVRAHEVLGGSDTPTVTRTIQGELV